MSKNRKVVLIFGGFITAVAAAFYPIFFHPLMHIEEYSKWKRIRALIEQRLFKKMFNQQV
ncbi:small integral membrane protein 20 isoform X2 [Ambystoma mexicanum]|uniref:small integral membrane protein 20 isoform X2 n=1 Tax=Ambystoma mexicanum TaxID=8296 RepID=UPI0037E79F02